jgi:hypothetical protein
LCVLSRVQLDGQIQISCRVQNEDDCFSLRCGLKPASAPADYDLPDCLLAQRTACVIEQSGV